MKFSGFNTTEKVGIGIGTNVPSRPLEVNGTGNDSVVRVGDGDTDGAAAIAYIEFGANSTSWNRHSYVGSAGADSHLWIVNEENADILFYANNAEKMVIKNDGNVGINTTAPSAILHIRSSGTARNVFYVAASDNGHLAGIYEESDGRGALNVRNAGGTATINLDSGNDSWFTGGNFGIGTTAPGSLLTISGNSDDGDDASALRIVDEDSTGGSKLPAIMFYGGSTIQGRIRGGDGTFAIAVGSTPTTALSIDTSTRKLTLDTYGSGTHTGTSAYKLSVDSSGNIIETDIGAGAVDGAGTAGYIPKWTDSDTIGNSIMSGTSSAITVTNGAGGWNTGLVSINTNADSSPSMILLHKQSASPANGDYIAGCISKGRNSANQDHNYVEQWAVATNVTDGAESSKWSVGTWRSGTEYSTTLVAHAGCVGIGTASPGEALTLDSASNTRLLMREGGSNKGQIAAGGGGLYIQNLAGDVIFRNISDADTVRIKNDGKVGIGTTAPGEKLHIAGTDAVIKLVDSAATSAGYVDFDGTALQLNTNRNPNTGAFADTSKSHAGIAMWGGNGGSTINCYTANANNTAGTSRIFIKADGNVGIGDTTPNRKLDVNGTFRVTGASDLDGAVICGSTLTINGNISNTAASAYYYLNNVGTGNSGLYVAGLSSRMRFHVPANNYYEWEIGGVHKMRMVASGSVGIGTTAPATTLDVNGIITSRDLIKIGAAGVHGQITFLSDRLILNGASGKALSLGTNGAWDKLFIDTAGKVGIGTTSPSVALEIKTPASADAFKIIDRSSSDVIVYASFGSTSDEGLFDLLMNNATKVRLRANAASYFTGGSVGIGTTSPGAILDSDSNADWSSGWRNNLRLTSDYYPCIRFYSQTINKTSLIGNNNDGGLWFGVNGSGDAYSGYGMVIKPDGKVGIGTTAPTKMLEVKGTEAAIRIHDTYSNVNQSLLLLGSDLHASNTKDSWIKFFGGAATNDRTWSIGHNGNAMFRFNYLGTRATAPTGGTTILNLDGINNRVGIGTTAPGSVLNLWASTQRQFHWYAGTSPSGNNYVSTIALGRAKGGASLFEIKYDSEGTEHAYLSRLYVNATLHFDKQGSDHMTILADGNVGIGTNAPTEKVHIWGAGTQILAIQGDGGSGPKFTIRAGGTLTFSNDNTPYMNLNASGRFTLNTYGSGTHTGTAAYKLSVTSGGIVIETPIGAGAVDGAGTANYISKWTDGDTIGNSSIFEDGLGSLQMEAPSGGRFLTLNAPTNGGYITFETADTAFADIGSAKGMTANAAYSATDLMIGTRSGTKNIVFGMNGVEKVRIDNNGNVGIGTTSPAATLDVRRISTAGSKWTAAFCSDNQTLATARSHDSVLIQASDVPCLKIYEAASTPQVATLAVGDGNATLASSNTLRFFVNGSNTGDGYNGLGGTEAITINTSGSVGIGTPPLSGCRLRLAGGTYPLRVVAGSGEYYFASGVVYANSGGGMYFVNQSNYLSLGAHNYQMIMINGASGGAGKVGVNEATPNAALHVTGRPSYTTASLAEVSGLGFVRFQPSSTVEDSIWIHNAGGHVGFQGTDDPTTDTTVPLTLNAYGGSVGIGTTAPATPLHVWSTSYPQFRVSYNSALYFTLDHAATLNVYGNDWYVRLNGSEKFRIKQDGKIGIGTNNPLNILTLHQAAGANIRFQNATTGRYFIVGEGVGANDKFSFRGNSYRSTDTLTVDFPNNRVGVNNISPSKTLDVHGDIWLGASGTSILGGAGDIHIYADNAKVEEYWTSGSDYMFKSYHDDIRYPALGTKGMSIGSDVAPRAILDITGNNSTGMFNAGLGTRTISGTQSFALAPAGTVTVSGNESGMIGSCSSVTVSGNRTLVMGLDNTLAIGTVSTSSILSIMGGSVGIGTTDPGQKLHVNGNIIVNAQILTPGGSNLALNPNTGLVTVGGALTATGNITTNGSQFYFYRAVNSGNPEFHIGSAAAERLTIQSVYASGAQTLASVSFRTFSSLGAANAGQMNFYVDNSSTEILKIQDSGIATLALTATTGNFSGNFNFDGNGTFGTGLNGAGNSGSIPAVSHYVRGYSVQYDTGGSGARLTNTGFLTWWTGAGWTSNERMWSLTNAYNISGGTGRFALLRGDNNTRIPTLGNSGGLGTGTTAVQWWDKDNNSLMAGELTVSSTVKAAGKLVVGSTATPISKFQIHNTQSDTMTDGEAFLALYGNGGDGLLMGQRATTPYGAWIQAGYVPNIGTSHHYPLLLQPHGSKVGIGTTNPTARLYVYETANNAWALQVKGTGTSANYGLEVNCAAGAAASSQPFKVDTPSGGPFFIDGNGNVGIGDGTPTYKLDVNGTGRFTGALTGTTATFSGAAHFGGTTEKVYMAGNYLILDGANGTIFRDSGSNKIIQNGAYFRPDGNNNMYLGASANRWAQFYSVLGNFTGNVIIGRNQSMAPRLVLSSAAKSSNIGKADTGMALSIDSGAQDNNQSVGHLTQIGLGLINAYQPTAIGAMVSISGAYTAAHLVFATRPNYNDIAPTERMRITDAGKVFIGDTTASNAQLRVKQSTSGEWGVNIINHQSVAYGLSIDTSSAASTAAYNFAAYTPAGTGFFVTNTGCVGIGTATPLALVHTQKRAAHNLTYLDTFSATNAHGSNLYFRKSDNNTGGTKTQTDDGDNLGTLGFYGVHTGGDWGVSAAINVSQQGASGGTYVPSHISFATCTASAYAEKMRILPDGNVGIGTTSPSEKLQVVGNLYVQAPAAAGNDVSISIMQQGSNVNTDDCRIKFMQSEGWQIEAMNHNANGNSAYDFGINYNRNAHAGDFYIANNGTKRLKLDSSGHLLPAANGTYNLGGPGNYWANCYFESTAINGTLYVGGVLTAASNVDVAQYIRHTGDTNTQLRFESSQITIGTSGGSTISLNNDENIYFYSDSTEVVRFSDNNASDPQVQAANGKATRPSYSFFNDVDLGMYRDGADILRFSTAGVARLSVIANGNVGIGTDTPETPFHVYDNNSTQSIWKFQNYGTGMSQLSVYQGSSNLYLSLARTDTYGSINIATQPFYIKHYHGAWVNTFSINTSGQVGINDSDASYMLDVNGTFRATDDGYFDQDLSVAANFSVSGTKNFVIDHPTKEGMKLVHSCIEGPEAAVYYRGRAQSDTITLPDYWSGLVRDGTITVQLTPNGSFQHLYVVSTSLSEIKIGAAEGETIDCYYIIYGERADVAPLVVEDAAAWERFQERKSAMSDGKA